MLKKTDTIQVREYPNKIDRYKKAAADIGLTFPDFVRLALDNEVKAVEANKKKAA